MNQKKTSASLEPGTRWGNNEEETNRSDLNATQLWAQDQYEFLTAESYAADRAFAAQLRATMAGIKGRFPVWAMAAPPPRQKLGPLTATGGQLIQPAGWRCQDCSEPVMFLRQAVPDLVPRLVIHACECGAVVGWEDEQQPSRKLWPHFIGLLKEADAKVLMLHNGRETPGFSGVN
jgi:hypothetical protein